jgi:transforming growth factor-beta-induced protein
MNELLEDPTGALAQILLYHVVSGSVASGDLSDGMVVETLQGQSITVTIDEDGNVFINEAQVTVADLVADNGIVHVIDAVLLPEVVETTTVADIISGSPDHTVLLTALVAAELFDVLDDAEGGPFTVFAPTDAAFGEIDPAVLNELLEDPTGALAQILLYHVVSGSVASEDLSDGMVVETLQGQSITVTIDEDGNVFINEAQVTVADLVADNGIVHVIDAVLLPEIVNTFTVADIISGSPDHTVLLTALVAADLLDVLDDADGDFTVFAPTDAAFAALPPGLIEALLQDPTGLLSEILLFHVVGGTALSSDLADGQFLYPLGGGVINVSISGGVVRVNGAQVTVADLVADNGVVHVIDAVLLPLPCLSFVEGPYNDFNAQFGGAPSPDENGNCETFTITDFEAWASEIYVVDNFRQGVTYTFSICEGPNAGSWPAELTVFDANQQLVAFELNNCSITWVAPADGTYFIGINEAGACGASSTNLTVNNGNPSLTCQGEARNTVFDIIFNSPDHNTLTAVLELSGLDEALNGEGPFTVFAPTDDAFSLIPEEIIEELIGNPALLVDILLYHVVGDNALSTDLVDGQEITTLNGETVRVTINANGVFINDAQVTVADLVADNGVVHVIDAVLLPPTELPTVFDIISNSPVHTTLATAINAAQLGGTLSGEGPFTVFAPTDEAFAALPEGLLEELLADPAGALTSILLYHVVGGTAFSSDLTNGQSILTLNGESVTIRIEGSSVFVNDAQVIIADLEASNGVVHVINAVLVPEPNAVRNADISTDLEVFPNPAQEQIYIKGQEFGQDASYEIRDMNGRVLRTGFLTPGMGIPVSGMNAGYYLLMITSEKGVKLGKFAKM